jgi:hypothetical protein
MYNKIEKLNDQQFRRKTGVKRNTFNKTLEIVLNFESKRKKLSGRPLKLSYEDQILLSLSYLREYTTYFSLAQSFAISEANCYKICKRIEDILIKADEFKLPNKKEIYEDVEVEVLVVDATETRIQRPKKSKGNTTQERKSVIQSKLKS